MFVLGDVGAPIWGEQDVISGRCCCETSNVGKKLRCTYYVECEYVFSDEAMVHLINSSTSQLLDAPQKHPIISGITLLERISFNANQQVLVGERSVKQMVKILDRHKDDIQAVMVAMTALSSRLSYLAGKW